MPITIQMMSRFHVSPGKLSMRPTHETIPRIGTSGTNATLNGRCISGLRTRSTQTPPHTITNASSVPIETSSPSNPMGKNAATAAATVPVTIVVT